jgi:glyoxylase-like metal-dependent hydrolase (beta-lactamase superfamily II)
MTGPGTNTYLVGGSHLFIIDPGPALEIHLNNIIAALDTLRATAQAIILTHQHADHTAGAESLARRLAIPILSFGQPLQPGDKINLQPSTLIVFHTPGHTSDHLCLWLAEPRLLLAGDLVAGEGTILIVPPDGDMAAYLDSLRAMLALTPAAILPGHGPVITEPMTLLRQYLDHRLRREQQVLEWLAQGYSTAADIAARIYAGQPVDMSIAALQVEAHLEKLRREGRV